MPTENLPGYHSREAFPGAGLTNRPIMAYLGRMLEQYWKIRTVAMTAQAYMIVEYQSSWWTVSDNGGEIHMWRINDDGLPPPDAPYSQRGICVPIGRLSWFVAMTIMGESIGSYGANESVDDLIIETGLASDSAPRCAAVDLVRHKAVFGDSG